MGTFGGLSQMEFIFFPMTRSAAQSIDQWHYPGIYRFYDLSQDDEDRLEFLNSDNWSNQYFSVANEHRELIGFFIFDQETDVVTLGLGLHPDITGQGLGVAFVQAGLTFADEQFQPKRYELSVATFNTRAIQVYKRCGFVEEKTFVQATNGGDYEFVKMSRLA